MFTRQILLLPIFVFCLLGTTGCSNVSDPSRIDESDDEMAAGVEEFQRAVDTFYNAWYDSDWDLFNSFYAADVVFIDSSGDHMSLDEQNVKAAQQSELIGSVILDNARENLVLTVRVSPTGEAGVAYWTFPFEYQTEDGVTTTVNYTESDVWWKIDEEWKVVLLHYDAISKSDLQSE